MSPIQLDIYAMADAMAADRVAAAREQQDPVVAPATIPPAGDGLDDLGPEQPDELLIGAVGQQAPRCRCEPGPVVDRTDPHNPTCVMCGKRAGGVA